MWYGLLLLMSFVSLWGCMDPKPSYQECVEIETARCDVRDRCQGTKAFDKAYPNFDLETCVAYSEEHCRTRKIKGEGWDEKDVKACVKAVNGLSCGTLIPRGIDETEPLPMCDFIEAPQEEDEEQTDSVQGDTDTGTNGNPSDIFTRDAGM